MPAGEESYLQDSTVIRLRHVKAMLDLSKLPYNFHYGDAIVDMMASQITSLVIVYLTVYSGADQRKHQSSASLAFVRGIHRGPVNSPHKWPVTRKMFPFDDVIMNGSVLNCGAYSAIATEILESCTKPSIWSRAEQPKVTTTSFV